VRTRSRPVIYLRVSHGGRAAAAEQEQQVRTDLAAVGVDSRVMHVSCDLDSPGGRMGPALLALLEEASFGLIETVIVREVGRLGTEHSALVAVLLSLRSAGVDVLITEALALDPGASERLRAQGAERPLPRLTLGWGEEAEHRHTCQ